MNRTLKNYLTQNIQDQAQVENIITKAIPDNLDLGCALIKKAVIQSAQEAIRKDQAINQSIQQRSLAFTQGKQFRDEAFLREIPAIVPQELRPRIGGLSLQQFLVYDEFQKERKNSSSEAFQVVSNSQKLLEILSEKGPVKGIKDLLNIDINIRDQLIDKIYAALKETKEEVDMEYYIEICEILKEFIQPQQAWVMFKEKADLTKKQIRNLVRKLVREKFFQDSCLSQLDEGNEEEQKAINMFQKWLDTAREEIQPFLQSLQEIFNKSQNQIRNFFEYSLNYALQKVQNSISPYHQSIDTTYIEDYSKLIIISYKLIASNNSNIFLEHTLQAILQIFNRCFAKDTKINHQRAFFKLFLNLICDATRKQYDFHKDKITSFYYILAREFHKINPTLYSNFAFAWFELISNKYFMPTLLEKYEYWDVYFELICDLFKFARENLPQEGLVEHSPCQIFYKGIFRIIIILIHDFPDFLSAFSLQLCLHIPEKYLQMRNIMLSAYPRELKFRSPKAISNRDELQKQSNISNLPKYYKVKFDKQKYNQFISLFQNNDKTLKQKLQAESDENLQIFVLYFAWLQECQLSVTNSRKLLTDIIISLQGDLKEKMMKFVLNLIRYPNMITCFFIDFVTTLVFKGTHEKTRNLLLTKMFERINIESAHPWGMLYLVSQFQTQKNELTKLQIPKQILSRL